MPSTSWKETIAADENERFERHAAALRDLQRKRAVGGTTHRALHAKQHAGVNAELEIHADLPEHARHGLFSRPGKHRGHVRFSNGAPAHQHDKKGDVRGLALKLLGVQGKKALGGDATTQDFLLIHSPATPFRTPDEFVAFVRAAATPATLLFRLIAAVGIVRAVQIVRDLASGSAARPVASLAETAFYSALPIRVGPYAARYALVPLQQPGEATIPGDLPGDYLGRDVAVRLRRGPLAWDMKLQFFEDEARTPIEDASVDWDAPYVTVGRLTLPQQDVDGEEGKRTSELVERLPFDPWHALVEHTPLGAMMRARKHAYFASTQERKAAPDPA